MGSEVPSFLLDQKSALVFPYHLSYEPVHKSLKRDSTTLKSYIQLKGGESDSIQFNQV